MMLLCKAMVKNSADYYEYYEFLREVSFNFPQRMLYKYCRISFLWITLILPFE